MTVKLIALDLDGTTINNDRVISQRNRQALQAAADKGVNIVIATGRTFSALPKDVFEIPAIRYVLTSNGARITDLAENRTVYENCISPFATEKAVELLRSHKYVVECFVEGVAYIEKSYFEYVKEGNRCFRDREYILKTRNPVEGIYEYMLANKGHLENININFDDVSEKPAMREKLLTLPEVTITTSFPHNLEIGGATTSKAEALRELGRILGVLPEEMMAVGDSPNDIAMLQACGLPVAVGNAVDEVKAVVKYVAPANHEDGVADAVERFVLQP